MTWVQLPFFLAGMLAMLSYRGLVSVTFVPWGAMWLFPILFLMGGSAFFVYYVIVEKLVQPPLVSFLALKYVAPELELYTAGLFAGIALSSLMMWIFQKMQRT